MEPADEIGMYGSGRGARSRETLTQVAARTQLTQREDQPHS